MTVMIDAASVRGVTTGILVERAAATTPQGVDGALFTITGGRIVLVAVVGEVTVALENLTNNTRLKFNPDATGVDQDICANLNTQNFAIGELLTITGTVGDAMVNDLLIGNGTLASPLVLSEGDIELDCANSRTGEISWAIIYVPLDSAAVVVAA